MLVEIAVTVVVESVTGLVDGRKDRLAGPEAINPTPHDAHAADADLCGNTITADDGPVLV